MGCIQPTESSALDPSATADGTDSAARQSLYSELSNYKMSLFFGYGNDGLRTGVEFEKIAFNTVAEDHAVFRHLRQQTKRLAWRHVTAYQCRRRSLARERLAHRKKQKI